jgi:hypothetical protein
MFQNLCVDTKNNWKWVLKYADCDIWKGTSNGCLSVKYTQSSNFFVNGQKVIVSNGPN